MILWIITTVSETYFSITFFKNFFIIKMRFHMKSEKKFMCYIPKFYVIEIDSSLKEKTAFFSPFKRNTFFKIYSSLFKIIP